MPSLNKTVVFVHKPIIFALDKFYVIDSLCVYVYVCVCMRLLVRTRMLSIHLIACICKRKLVKTNERKREREKKHKKFVSIFCLAQFWRYKHILANEQYSYHEVKWFFFASAFVFNSFSSVPKLKSKAYAKAQQKIQKFVIGISLSSAKYRDFKALAAFKVIDMNAISKKKISIYFSSKKKEEENLLVKLSNEYS